MLGPISISFIFIILLSFQLEALNICAGIFKNKKSFEFSKVYQSKKEIIKLSDSYLNDLNSYSEIHLFKNASSTQKMALIWAILKRDSKHGLDLNLLLDYWLKHQIIFQEYIWKNLDFSQKKNDFEIRVMAQILYPDSSNIFSLNSKKTMSVKQRFELEFQKHILAEVFKREFARINLYSDNVKWHQSARDYLKNNENKRKLILASIINATSLSYIGFPLYFPFFNLEKNINYSQQLTAKALNYGYQKSLDLHYANYNTKFLGQRILPSPKLVNLLLWSHLVVSYFDVTKYVEYIKNNSLDDVWSQVFPEKGVEISEMNFILSSVSKEHSLYKAWQNRLESEKNVMAWDQLLFRVYLNWSAKFETRYGKPVDILNDPFSQQKWLEYLIDLEQNSKAQNDIH